MHKNNVPFKVAIGYSIVAIVLILAITLVYNNTRSILSINQASREYIKKRDAADSTMSALLKEEQANLRQLSNALEGKSDKNYLQEKVKSLNNGKDSIVVHPKTAKTHEAQSTTVEVVKTRKGFFRRLADAFKKEHAETLSVKKDSNKAIIDSLTTPVNVAEKVADILEQIEKKEKNSSHHHSQAVNKEMEDLRMVNAQLALRSAKQLNEVHQRERDSMQQAINKAMEARQHLLWQIGLLAIIAILAAIVLLWYIYRDTQKERIYRENLENANEEIQRIMQQRERLLLTITHDIKAPAASISGFIDLMKDYISDPQGISCLNNIKSSSTHLSHLVASLLDYHQLENGLMEIHPVNFSPTELVAESVETLRLQAESKGLGISYETTNPKDKNVESLYCADAFRIRQILNNLISNAIKYTETGCIKVSMGICKKRNECHIAEAPNTFLLTMSVKDTGKGMTTEEKAKIFQAFMRLKNAQGVEGTGLGLSITQELVALLGGEIQVNSTVGKGSTFTVTIPIESASKDSTITEKKYDNTLENHTEKPLEKSVKIHKILILDDDKLQLQLLQEMLRRTAGNDWQVIACNHVTEALTALHNEQPSVMLMDIEMPEMNGMELIKHINHANMKVIAMTAHDSSIMDELRNAGFDDCLFKPFCQEKLQKILHIKAERAFGETSEKVGTKEINPRLKPLIAFAEDDEEAAKEIIKTVKMELENYLTLLLDAEKEEDVPTDKIGKIAHKLLPIATMLQMNSLSQLQELAPEHIQELDEQKIRECLIAVIHDLKDILGEITS